MRVFPFDQTQNNYYCTYASKSYQTDVTANMFTYIQYILFTKFLLPFYTYFQPLIWGFDQLSYAYSITLHSFIPSLFLSFLSWVEQKVWGIPGGVN